MLTWNWKN